MKTYLILFLLLLSSCVYQIDKEHADKHVHLSNYLIKIKRIDVAKYTRVYATTTYKGKEYQVISTDGYYYKEYNLKPGDEINVDIDIYYFTEKNDEDNLYDDTTYLVFEDIDLSKWEKK